MGAARNAADLERETRMKRIESRWIRVAVGACFALLAVACGGSTEPGARPGTASVAANGAVSTSGAGLAFFQSASSGGTSLFQIMLAPTTAATMWQVQVVNYSGRLPVGT